MQGFAGSAAAVASVLGLLAGGFLYGLIGAQIFAVSAASTLVVFLLTTKLILNSLVGAQR